MKDDIKPLSDSDPESPNFRARKNFSKKPGQELDIRKKDSGKKKKINKPSRPEENQREQADVTDITRANKQKMIREKRRARLEAQEKLNHRPDLTFFWGLLTLVIIGSLIIVGYLTFYGDNRLNKQTENQLTEVTEEDTTNQIPATNFKEAYYYLKGDDETIDIITGYQGTDDQQIITQFTPPADINNVSGAWDNDHKFAYTSDKGVEIYNQQKNSKSILAPNRGNREYYYVSFGNNDQIYCLYTKGESSYLEIYSSSLKLLRKNISAQVIDWDYQNHLTYLNIDTKNDKFQFLVYTPVKKKFIPYYSNYIGLSRYPIAFANSKVSDQTALLLRDDSGVKSSIILSLGDRETNKLTKLTEILYLDKELENNEIIRPTIVWDKKEDYLYVSINNQMFKVNISTGETEELSFDFNGTITAISEDNKYLYIRKDDSTDSQIEKPETIIVYDQGVGEIVGQSSLAQVAEFLNYNFWTNN